MPGCFACLKRRAPDSSHSLANQASCGGHEDPAGIGQSQTILTFSSANHNNKQRSDDLNSVDTFTNVAAGSLSKGDQLPGEQASRINFLLSDDATSCVSFPELGQASLLTVDESRSRKQQQNSKPSSDSADCKSTTAVTALLNMQNLETLVPRLEAVAGRLERLAEGRATTSSSGPPPPPPPATSSASAGVSKPWVAAYGDYFDSAVSDFLKLSAKLGGDVAHAGGLVGKAFEAQKKFLAAASGHRAPSDADLPKHLKPQADAIGAVVSFKDANRPSKQFDHLSALAEGIAMIGWVTVKPTPAPFVRDNIEAAQFYTNRVLKNFKGKSQDDVDWANGWIRIGNELANYVKQHHTTGLAWTEGGPAMGTASSGGPPPPPPPPCGVPPPPPPMDTASAKGGEDARALLFASLNRGDQVTSGLRKVTDDMKTHKNPNLRAGAVVSASAGAGAPKTPPKISPKPGRKVAAKPVLELVNNKWMVENHISNKEIVISETERKHTVYIFKCVDCTVQVKGKINSIVIDSCKKVALAFDDLISALDVVNSQSIQAQVMGVVSLVNIDKTDGFQIYLSKDCKDADLVTAKSSEMNVLIPTDDGDFTEYPLPEQYKTNWTAGGLKTVVADN